VSPNLANTLSAADAKIDYDLANALLTTNMSLLKAYGITYIVISTPPNMSVGSWPAGEPEFVTSVYILSVNYGTIAYISKSNTDVTTVYKIE
jgi:hypothetical protein